MKGAGEAWIEEKVVQVTMRAAQSEAGQQWARAARLNAAWERQLPLDQDQVAREQRIDEATVDVELAYEAAFRTIVSPALGGYRISEVRRLGQVRAGQEPTISINATIKTETGEGTYRKPIDAVFPTRNGTWQQVNNVERRWRQIRSGTGLEWVTPHPFRHVGDAALWPCQP